MTYAAVWMILLPLAGFLALVAFGRKLGEPGAGYLGTAAIAGSFVAAIITFFGLMSTPRGEKREVTQHLFSWIHAGGFKVAAGLLIDPLSITMCLFITGISMLIHLYSVGYMHGERDFSKFFIYLNLFVASMLVLVLSSNLLFTFVGWEGVGVCSYWLVAFYFDRESAASAGKKAFTYNRIGDVGLLLAAFLAFQATGSLDYTVIFSHLGWITGGTATLMGLALLLAASGKSAQIPLFNWLPDAMEGPTPVSALIHAATMVTAGVYLLCRMAPVLHHSPAAEHTIMVIGAFTAFVAATVATSQKDIKKVLAFSTVSQIGYMVMAVGAGAYVAAIFLMVAHAFYKALLFLGAGSVIHGLHEEQDIRHMGALRKVMPWTFGTFMIGWLAIAGVPPFSGFWAKGDVLGQVWPDSKVLWALGLLTAVLTAYYMTRLFVVAFTGEARRDGVGPNGEAPIATPHESPWTMRLPLVILAAFALAGGIFDLPWLNRNSLLGFLAPVFEVGHAFNEPVESSTLQITLASLDAVAAVAGVTLGWLLWRGRASRPALEPKFFEQVWYWDEAYDTVIGRPAVRAAHFAAEQVDVGVIDAAVEGAARGVGRLSRVLRGAQTGYVRHYALAVAAGMVILLTYLLVVAS